MQVSFSFTTNCFKYCIQTSHGNGSLQSGAGSWKHLNPPWTWFQMSVCTSLSQRSSNLQHILFTTKQQNKQNKQNKQSNNCILTVEYSISSLCGAAALDDVASFFASHPTPAAATTIKQGLESISMIVVDSGYEWMNEWNCCWNDDDAGDGVVINGLGVELVWIVVNNGIDLFLSGTRTRWLNASLHDMADWAKWAKLTNSNHFFWFFFFLKY